MRRPLWSLLAGAAVGMLAALPLKAGPEIDALVRAIDLPVFIAIMRDEGLDYAEELGADFLPGGGSYWLSEADRIYDTTRMQATVQTALNSRLTPQQAQEAADFFDTELGRRVIGLETAARAAMKDPAVEEIALETQAELRATDTPRVALLDRFVTINDLVERNVAGALSSNYQFMTGLADGGAIEATEDDILSDVWSQEQQVRADADAWVYGYLSMAYRPLSDAELSAYTDFSETAAGRALNAALFDGFDQMYNDISYALGRSIAGAMDGSDL